jgi:hypothetical protein
MKKMLIVLLTVLTIGSSLMAGCNSGRCCPDYNGCCAGEKQACTLVGGTGQVAAAKRWQCEGDCSCGCNRSSSVAEVVRVA